MTHDPLCLAADGEPCHEHGTPACPCDCQCDLIAKVRADERQQESARRMSKFGYWHDYRPEMP